MGYYPRYADFDDYLDLEERNSRFVLAMEKAHEEAQQEQRAPEHYHRARTQEPTPSRVR